MLASEPACLLLCPVQRKNCTRALWKPTYLFTDQWLSPEMWSHASKLRFLNLDTQQYRSAVCGLYCECPKGGSLKLNTSWILWGFYPRPMTTVRCSSQLSTMWRQLNQPQQLYLVFHRCFLCVPLTLNWLLFHAVLPFLLFSFQSFALFGFLPCCVCFISALPFLCPFLFTFFSYTLRSLPLFNHAFEPPGVASTMTRRRGASRDFGLITWLSDCQSHPFQQRWTLRLCHNGLALMLFLVVVAVEVVVKVPMAAVCVWGGHIISISPAATLMTRLC